jgi:hypothetical protein
MMHFMAIRIVKAVLRFALLQKQPNNEFKT